MGECTILIPTHNRHHFLDRCVMWFIDKQYPVVIADSSAQEWVSEYRSSRYVTYLWEPGAGFQTYISKVKKALDAVSTKYVNLCADDDFVTHDGIQTCVEYLNQHDDYSFAQGHSYLFQSFGERQVLWPMLYNLNSADGGTWAARMAPDTDTVYYGVNRADGLRDAFGFLCKQEFGKFIDHAAGFFDFAITAITARRGKLRRLPIPFSIREYSPITSAVGQRYQTIASDEVTTFYRNLIDHICEGDQCPGRDTMLRLCARHYADCILYDCSLPIRLTQTPTTCWVRPIAGVEFSVGRRLSPARDPQQ